jgi:hypothetical protein
MRSFGAREHETTVIGTVQDNIAPAVPDAGRDRVEAAASPSPEPTRNFSPPAVATAGCGTPATPRG